MHAPQLIDLQSVATYWTSRGLVPEKYIAHYIRWLQRFLVGPGCDSRLAASDAKAAFLRKLEQCQTPEWQIDQAGRAVDLYQKHFLAHQKESGTVPDDGQSANPALTDEIPKSLDEASAQTCRLIRLRHYSYRTEQTYLYYAYPVDSDTPHR